MKKLNHLITTALLTILLFIGVAAFGDSTVATALGWKMGKDPEKGCTLCGGHYTEPKKFSALTTLPNYKKVPVMITAKGPVIFRTNGVSVLQDHVEIRQPGRLLQADKALVYHDKKTGEITDITLIGHVRAQEPGKLLLGSTADYNIKKNTLFIHDAIYHIAGQHELLTVTTRMDAWGTAKSIDRKSNEVIQLTDATYTTCAPLDPAWTISAGKIDLNSANGEGTARNLVIRFQKIPIFYTPYYSFPLNDDRKSGFLTPSMGYQTEHGFYISEPYYWSIAPNYDLLITPEWYSDRGMQLNNTFRYLTAESDGFFYASILPNDQAFSQYKQDTLQQYPNNTTNAPYLTTLRNSSNHRGFFDFENNVQFNHNWTGKFNARYLTDDYYAQDFQTEYLTQNTNQVPSFAEIDYEHAHWQNRFLIQTYQTLHPFTQLSSPAQNQYTRLPELDFDASYPQFMSHYDFNFSAQAVHFIYHSDFSPFTYQKPIGNRLHFQPSISRPFIGSSFYITPRLTADSTSYFSSLASQDPLSARPTFDENRTLPIFNIDSGWYFDRAVHIGSKQYVQTLQPEFFYLYTPYLNQDSYPNFDTQLLPFSTSDLFSRNQFTGFDRLQNANQLSIGVTSNLLRNADASDVLSAQLGVINYFTPPRVCLVAGCQPFVGTTSPIAGTLTWNPNALWSFTSQAAWNTLLKQINNAETGVSYHLGMHRIITLNYQFTHGTPITFGDSPNSSLLTAGLVWPLTHRWHFFGYSYYDLTNQRPQSQYVGLSYGTCCWATRFIVSDNYTGTSQIGNTLENQYNTAYYMEFLLKGLGSTGNRRAEDMLTSTLPGFSDVFSKHGHYEYGQNI